MTVYLTLDQVLELHADGIQRYGGDPGIRDLGLVQSAVSQPRMSFAGQELYSTLAEKAAALGFSLIRNHGFLDGNKRNWICCDRSLLTAKRPSHCRFHRRRRTSDYRGSIKRMDPRTIRRLGSRTYC
ncbi:MAG: Fic family protein [Planctomycetota bacterium]